MRSLGSLALPHLRSLRTNALIRLPPHVHRTPPLATVMSRQTTLSFASQSAPASGGAASSAPPTSAQPQLARTSSKRKNYIDAGLDDLCRMFGDESDGDASATAAAAESTSAAAAPASSASSTSAAPSSSSSSAAAPLSRSAIRAIFSSHQHDLQKTIDALADQTGRHTDKHSNFTFSGSSGSSSGSGDVKKQRVGRMQLVEQRGDLFSCASSVALAHCVSVDLAMGKGIAVAFKTKFGGVAELKAQKKQIGEMAVLKHNGRYVYYLITKARYFNKPTYDSLESSLRCLRAHMEQHSVKHVAMPRIGCGLDQLLWARVGDTIRRVFNDLDCTITIYTL